MKPLAILALLAVVALPVQAGVVHNEAVNGDLSSDPANPTPINFVPGGNTIIGTVTNAGGADQRDYITFTIGANLRLIILNLVAFAPNNIVFAAFNSGTTSFIPSITTDPQFLSGIHMNANLVGTDILPEFVSNNVTSNALPAPELGPGSYCFLIQQTNTTLTSYTLEFVLDGGLPARESTWGAIKQLYR
jgi:hypothetical protein